jgi:NAD(P)H-dependent flavin oxidoreductase YrpB (nitropropane dioxygenase family)
MESLGKPWIAFKVLAAGAIDPREGLKYAFQQGADFACLGMFDFQVVEDANILTDVLEDSGFNRTRPWLA